MLEIDQRSTHPFLHLPGEEIVLDEGCPGGEGKTQFRNPVANLAGDSHNLIQFRMSVSVGEILQCDFVEGETVEVCKEGLSRSVSRFQGVVHRRVSGRGLILSELFPNNVFLYSLEKGGALFGETMRQAAKECGFEAVDSGEDSDER